MLHIVYVSNLFIVNEKLIYIFYVVNYAELSVVYYKLSCFLNDLSRGFVNRLLW